MQYKVMSLRTKEDGILQKILVFIHDLSIGDKVTGIIYKLFRSQRYQGQISGALVKIGDRSSDMGFIPGRYFRDWEEEDRDRKRKGQKPGSKKSSLKVGDKIIAEVMAINPQVEAYEAEIILRPIKHDAEPEELAA